MTETKENLKNRLGKFHDSYYKQLLLIPLIIFVLCLAYMFFFYSSNGDFIYRDITLTGGTSVTVYGQTDVTNLELSLSGKLEGMIIREISDLVTGQQKAVTVETTSDMDAAKIVLEEYFGYKLTEENSSFEFTGSALSHNFFKQLLIAIILALIFMAIVVFLIFRTFIPSAAIVLSAIADIFMTLTVLNIFEVRISTAGIVAFLMLIGYSVDTDILLTNRVLKRHEGSLNNKIYSAFKTGITMTLTSLVAVILALVVVNPISHVLSIIFIILVIGLAFDILNTWITNVSILKWYVLRKGVKNEN
ncbi:MAG: protein translocase subunit SecF [Nanoarchaeota archaeon]|nr:protein translocase subunit SecF [Nanoarchaeota archaeon]MBU1501445.1 protein translocase subunit SecF [Nanoarchaeota archaeon]MBU2458963.1 protein translocase subunit SecF [Nanoarchaeota archaeon]